MTTHETPESQEPGAWTNEAILRHLLRTVLTAIYDQPDSLLDAVRYAAGDPNPQRLRDRLRDDRLGILLQLTSLIDGNGPSDWPGVALVNAATGERLTDDLAWAISEVEGEVIDATEPPADSSTDIEETQT